MAASACTESSCRSAAIRARSPSWAETSRRSSSLRWAATYRSRSAAAKPSRAKETFSPTWPSSPRMSSSNSPDRPEYSDSTATGRPARRSGRVAEASIPYGAASSCHGAVAASERKSAL